MKIITTSYLSAAALLIAQIVPDEFELEWESALEAAKNNNDAIAGVLNSANGVAAAVTMGPEGIFGIASAILVPIIGAGIAIVDREHRAKLAERQAEARHRRMTEQTNMMIQLADRNIDPTVIRGDAER